MECSIAQKIDFVMVVVVDELLLLNRNGTLWLSISNKNKNMELLGWV